MLENLKTQMESESKELNFDLLLTDSLIDEEKEKLAEEKRIAWLNDRKGRATASESVRMMGYEDKSEVPDGLVTYAKELALQEIVGLKEEKRNLGSSVEWGNLYEVEANLKFQEKFNIKVEKIGDEQEFVKKGEHYGATPDGVIFNNEILEGGTETKCPDSSTHLMYLETLTISNFKKICTKYYWQIQGCMYATGAKYWYFISYDPRFKNENSQLLVLKINRSDEDINKLRRRLSQLIQIKTEIVNKYI